MAELLSYDELYEELRSGRCEVSFTKVNGETRVMQCTLKESLIPECPSPTTSYDKNRISVWDLEKNDWRSFRVNSLNYFMNKDSVDEVTANVWKPI